MSANELLPLVIFVDDEESVLAGLRRSFRHCRSRWELHFQSDPTKVAAEIPNDRIVVVVTDIRMPELSGIELAGKLATLPSKPVCLILSGSTDFDLAVSSINEGRVYRYYLKPCDADVLEQGIEDAIAYARSQQTETSPQPAVGEPFSDRLEFDALEIIPYGVVVLDKTARVRFVNQLAIQSINGSRGITLGHDGVLRAVGVGGQDEILKGTRRVIETGEVTGFTMEEYDKSPLRITLQPYSPDENDGDQLACVFIFTEGSNFDPDPRVLQEMFGLTKAEAALALNIARGLPIDLAASECQITTSSARTYLKRIFAKVGVTRQAELVRLILLSIAPRRKA